MPGGLNSWARISWGQSTCSSQLMGRDGAVVELTWRQKQIPIVRCSTLDGQTGDGLVRGNSIREERSATGPQCAR